MKTCSRLRRLLVDIHPKRERAVFERSFRHFSLWEGGPFPFVFSYSIQHHE
eukprot:c13283_g1_i1 orf=2-151(-)